VPQVEDFRTVRFSAEHHFDAPAQAVATLLLDPDFHARVALPDLSPPTVVDRTVDGSVTALTLRYEFVGQLDPIARKLLSGRSLTWVQELRLDEATERGRLAFRAEADPKRLYGDATMELVADAGGTTRRIDGDLHVRAPLIGGTAERRIVPGIVRRLDVEADALRARLAQSANQ
jgi:uncharacterized protein DUF2505